MSRIDPQFGQDFRPGYHPSPNPNYSLFEVLPQEDHPSDFDHLEEARKPARGILNALGLAAVAWSFIVAIILLVWGV
jgi:hypothetical protein